jgi:3-methylcrotonyl-CoA carboxylase alpha subunit
MREGDEIPIYYDALLAKLIAWGTDREDARRGLEAALAATEIGGVANNRDFLLRLVRHRDFAAGAIDTGFIARHRTALTIPLSAAPLAAVAAASLALLHEEPSPDADNVRDSHSPWSLHDGWRVAGETQYQLDWSDAGLERRITIHFGRSALRLTMDDETNAEITRIAHDGAEIAFALDSVPTHASVRRQGAAFDVALNGGNWHLRHLDALARRAGARPGPARLNAPVHGRVLDVLVDAGASVKRGQVLMLLECMKLEYRVTAPADGTVEALHFAAGDVVEDGVQLLTFTPAAN